MSKLENAAPEIMKILEAFVGSDTDLAYNYKYFEAETGLDRNTLKEFMTILRKLGYVKLYRGLMNDDGEVAGSGFSIAPGMYTEVEMAVRIHELVQRELPREMVLNGRTYRLVETNPQHHQ